MDNKKNTAKGLFNRSFPIAFLLYPIIIVFFVSMIVIYNARLYNSEKEKILEKGELSVTKSAEKFEECLSEGKDAVSLIAHDFEKKVQKWQSEGRLTDENIRDYLVTKTETVHDSLIKDTTGFYAYFNGQYYEGGGWVPDEGYDPTQRPWYQEIAANEGEITIVDPYLDLDTGGMILTIGKMLDTSDRDVLAIDITMDEIQRIAEDDAADEEKVLEMVLDKKGGVVAHTSKSMIGKELLEMSGTLESELAKELYSKREGNFPFEYDGKTYSVYSVHMADGWHSVTVIDDEIAFKDIRKGNYISGAFIVMSLVILTFIIVNSEKKKRRVNKVTAQLDSATNVYLSIYDIAVRTNRIEPIKVPDENVARFVSMSGGNTERMKAGFLASVDDEDTKKKMDTFLDFSNVDERFKSVNSESVEYFGPGDIWIRGRIVVSERDSSGNITHVLWMLENIDAEKRARDVLLRKADKLTAQMSSAADIYMSMCDLDLVNNDVIPIKNVNPMIDKIVSSCDHNMQELFFKIMKNLPESISKQAAIDFADLHDIEDRMRETNTVTLEYLSYGDIWVRARYVVSERDENGRITHVLWMLENIDKEKRARDALLKKTEKLTNQLKSAAEIYISICDLDIKRNDVTPIRNQNPAIANVVNSCDHNMQDLFFGIMRGLPDSSTKQAAIKFCDLSDIDERMKDTNTVTLEYISYGNIWVRARYVVSERDEEGRVTHVLWMLENIDAEKKAREELVAMTETLNKQIMSVADIYISVHDIDIVNDTFIEIKNTTSKVTDIMRRDMHDAQNVLFKAMNRVTDPSAWDMVREFVDLSTIEKRMTGTDSILTEYLSDEKTWRRGRFVVSERNNKGRITHVLWMVEDIDKEKKSRERLIDMSERAIAANEAKSAFLSNMSHEIRTPINALLGMNEMVLRECDDKNIISYSENIRTAGTTLLGLINDILDFSKIEAGKMEIIPVEYDLATMLKDLVNIIKTRAEAKDLQVLTCFDKDTPQYLKGDEVRLKQIITNILTNAVKYTEQGGITFSVGFEKIENDKESVYLCISVKDTGIGIKEEDMAKLFSKFERIEEKRNRNIEGTGLGMNITQSLLELMGSRLEVSSVYGEGSTFSFKIKQTVRKWDALGDYEDAYRKSMSSRHKYKESFTAPDAKVLVVDDMPMNILVFTSLLKQTGVRIDTAENGDDAVALAAKNRYDVIFLDHMMPNKDGIQTLKEMRADKDSPNAATPTICLTANAISGAREKYMEAGFDDYLTKPIESDKLEEMLYEYLPHDKILRSAVNEQQAVESEDKLPDFLFGITEIDVVTGIKYCGSEKLYLEALRSYSRSINGYLFRLKKYWISGDVKDTMVMVHNIKSASKTIGAEWISNLALAVETSAGINDSASMNDNLDLLSERCKRLSEQLSALSSD